MILNHSSNLRKRGDGKTRVHSTIFVLVLISLFAVNVMFGGFWGLEDTKEMPREKSGQSLAARNAMEDDFLPPSCHDFVVQDFPSLTALAKIGKGADMGSGGGAWSACTHVQLYGFNFAAFFVRHLAFGLRPSSVLEFGCGLGTTSDFLARFVPGGSKVVCIEPEAMLSEVFGGEKRKDFPQRPLQLAMNTFTPEATQCADSLFTQDMNFELVISFEVAEHIPAEHHLELVARLASATSKYLVFSAARPKQGGTGHLDESMHDRSWWIDHFTKTGKLRYLPQLSLGLRFVTAWSERAYDFGTNLIAFGAEGVPDVPDIPSVAHDCLFLPQTWWAQAPDEFEKAYALKHQMNTTVDVEKCQPPGSPEQRQSNIEKRRLWIEGQCQALWPELDLLIRRVKSGQIQCA